MAKEQAPSMTYGQGDSHEVYEHPAYGVATLMIVTGQQTLFGSDLTHQQTVRIAVKRASHKRDLSNDWYHSKGLPVVEFELSHAQFAEFITSPGRGDGIPCTIRYIDGTAIPGIEPVETKQQMLRREIEESARKRLGAIGSTIQELGELLDTGKLSGTALRAIHAELVRHAQQLPGSIAFVVEQGEEALEKATAAAKIEIEALVTHHVNRLGTEQARVAGLIAPEQKFKEIE